MCSNIESVSFELIEKQRVKERYGWARPGRAGPGRFITNIDYMFKNIKKLFYRSYR